MVPILDWIFEGIVNWVASIVTSVMDAISGIFLGALGTDMTAMEEYFPFVTHAFEIMQYMAWALLLLITVWQLFRSFGGPLLEAENPWHLVARSAIFAVLIGYARPIFGIALDIARAPYIELMDARMTPGDFTFAGIEQAMSNGLVTIVSMASVVGTILLLILLITLGWNYFKLLLEVVERYVVVGVLCYTSPLAFAMGGSKMTGKIFQSWCRMVGSQLLLLVMNVWFLRAFSSGVGHFVVNGGALSSGQGNIFLWLFCAIAFLKTAQKFDSILASLGLSVAQTGGGLGMELLAATRLMTTFGGGSKGAGGMSRGGGSSIGGGSAGASAAGAAGGFAAGFASKFKPNSYVRDATVEGGTRMGASGGLGFVGRAFGGIAARNGATLTGDSVASVASRPAAVSGTIAGDIADRSVGNFMPQLSEESLKNTPLSGGKLTGTQITGGHISTRVTGANGKEASVELFSANHYEKPDTPHSVATASDGSQWYQIASGNGMNAFHPTPSFTGDSSEMGQVSEAFPAAPEGTTLRTVGDGVLEASHPDGGSSLWYNGAHFQEPDAPHETIQSADGQTWYAMQPHADAPQFDGEADAAHLVGGAPIPPRVDGVDLSEADSPEVPLSPEPPQVPFQAFAPGIGADEAPFVGGAPIPPQGGGSDSGGAGASAVPPTPETPQARFHQFMPGFGQQATHIDSSRHTNGMLEVRHADGSGTAFYDKSMYRAPRGDHHVYEDRNGGQWYAIPGAPTVERRPVYENGKPIYDDGKLRTYNVETIRYKSTPTRFEPPAKRDLHDRRPPKPKKRR